MSFMCLVLSSAAKSRDARSARHSARLRSPDSKSSSSFISRFRKRSNRDGPFNAITGRNSLPDVRGYGVEESNPHFTPGSWRNGGGGGGGGGVGGAVLDVGVGGNMGPQRPPGNHVPNVRYSTEGGKSTLQMPGEPILRRLSDFGGSADSMDTNGEDDSDRRGSVTGSSVGKDGRDKSGMGSRLSDLMEKGKGRKKDKRKKDKQGERCFFLLAGI